MKKVILALSVMGLMTACGSSNETEAPKTKTDSTAVSTVDTTVSVTVTATDSVSTDSVVVSATK